MKITLRAGGVQCNTQWKTIQNNKCRGLCLMDYFAGTEGHAMRHVVWQFSKSHKIKNARKSSMLKLPQTGL